MVGIGKIWARSQILLPMQTVWESVWESVWEMQQELIEVASG
jgi:hypothetical protein